MVFRKLRKGGPPFAELQLPPVVERLAGEVRGLVLVTGPTGSGKTTTLAAMVEHINRTRPVHIVTIEDPIEVLHADHTAWDRVVCLEVLVNTEGSRSGSPIRRSPRRSKRSSRRASITG
jgi:Tfp pilus assembly pilus retraction ATPase PilT